MQNRVLILSGFNFNSRDYLETVNTATHFPNLLDMEARQTPLGLLEFKDFTTDVAVIKKSALEAGHPEKGLVVLFDIHKCVHSFTHQSHGFNLRLEGSLYIKCVAADILWQPSSLPWLGSFSVVCMEALRSASLF